MSHKVLTLYFLHNTLPIWDIIPESLIIDMLNKKRGSADFSSMISNIKAACGIVARSYSLETLEENRQPLSPKNVNLVKRGGSLKTPPAFIHTSKRRNRLSTPSNQMFHVEDNEEYDDTDDEDKPPSTAPPPPPIEENESNSSYPSPTKHLNILKAIDDLDLRESASCNF